MLTWSRSGLRVLVAMSLIRPLLACSHSLRLSWQGSRRTRGSRARRDPRLHPVSRRRHSPTATNSRVSRRTTRMCKRARTTYQQLMSVWSVWRTASIAVKNDMRCAWALGCIS
ncbi:hypothetical protein QBC39DRAFT_148208 [Podospora conica]|nr:hypothetical protein QBC39DRAFT_148208 [Schizothecium conicum]